MRSHSRVVQGCAGEESRNDGPLMAHGPEGSAVVSWSSGCQDPMYNGTSTCSKWCGKHLARPFSGLTPDNSF